MLDAQIARQVMGWRPLAWQGENWQWDENLPRFSTDWGAAGQVVNWLHRRHWYIEPVLPEGTYPVTVHLWKDVFDAVTPTVDVEGVTFPHAICLAALEAVALE
jgi:hypothetical protein